MEFDYVFMHQEVLHHNTSQMTLKGKQKQRLSVTEDKD